MNKSETYDLE
jgi:hypothetical protein